MGIGHTINTIEDDWWYSEKPATGFMARKCECLVGLLGLHTLLNRLYKDMMAKWPLRFTYLFSFNCPVSRVLVSCNSRTFSCTEECVFALISLFLGSGSNLSIGVFSCRYKTQQVISLPLDPLDLPNWFISSLSAAIFVHKAYIWSNNLGLTCDLVVVGEKLLTSGLKAGFFTQRHFPSFRPTHIVVLWFW